MTSQASERTEVSSDQATRAPGIVPTHPLYEVGTTLGSIATCAAVVVELFLAMLVLTMIAPLIAATLDHFDTSPPPLTAWVVGLPPLVTFPLMLVLIVAVVAKEWLMANKRLTLIINLVLLGASLIWIPLLVSALVSAPWAELIYVAQ